MNFMQAVTLHPSPAIPAPRRRWQFGLRTLLGFVTLAAVLCDAASWWVTLPVRTWNAFVARVQAGDIEGANALCDLTMVRIVPGSTRLSHSALYRPISVNLTRIRSILSDVRPEPRTWSDIVQGRVRLDSPATAEKYWLDLEVRRGSVLSGNPTIAPDSFGDSDDLGPIDEQHLH
jgi:hypothetical protein